MTADPGEFRAQCVESHRPRMKRMFSGEADRAGELVRLSEELTRTFERIGRGAGAGLLGRMLVGGLVYQQATAFDAYRALGKPMLHRLKRSDRSAELPTIF